MNRLSRIALALLAITGLSACGGSIDSRQIDWEGGLAYKHGSTTPFTGTAEYKGSVPNELVKYWNDHYSSAVVSASGEVYMANCEVHYTNGVMDGRASCDDAKGQTLLDVSIKDEHYDGTATLRDPATGKVVQTLDWKAGHLNGDAIRYAADGQELSAAHWTDGVQDGTFKTWDKVGTPMTDVTMKDGKPVTGTVANDISRSHYKDGVLEGQVEFYRTTYDASGKPSRETLAKGEVTNGQRVGVWETKAAAINSANSLYPFDQHRSSMPSGASKEMHAKLDHATLTFKGDQLDGPVKAYDVDNHLILDGVISDGKVTSPFKIVSGDGSGTLVTVDVAAPVAETKAGNPSPTQILIFQFQGSNGPEPAYCSDEGQDGVMCRSDTVSEIGSGTYRDYMIKGTPICIAGTAGCVAPKILETLHSKG